MTEKEDLLDEAAELGLDFPKRATIDTITEAIAKKKAELEGEDADEDPTLDEEEEEDDDGESDGPSEEDEEKKEICYGSFNEKGRTCPGSCKDIKDCSQEEDTEMPSADEPTEEEDEEEEPEKEVPKGPVYSCGCGFQGTKEQVDYHVETSHPVEKMDPKENFTQVLTQQGMKGARKLINDENELKEMLENSVYELLVSTADNMKIPTHGDMDALVERLMNPPTPVKGRDYYQLNDYFLPTGGKVALPKGPVIISTFEKTIADKDHAIPGLMVRVLEKV